MRLGKAQTSSMKLACSRSLRSVSRQSLFKGGRRQVTPRERAKLDLQLVYEHLCGLKQPIRVVYTTGNWLDVDTLEDVIRANNFI